MGVEILWFMPIHPIGAVNRKGTLGSYYSITDYTEVNPEYGSKADFAALVEQVHALGMKIILDWVANHTAWDNVWTKTNPEFFIKDEHGQFKPPYDWEDVLQIDHSNAGEQQAMIDAMKYWVNDFDIDGFRADLAHLTPLAFWVNARTQLTALKENLIWLAETEEVQYHDAFDISFTWKWMHMSEEYCKGQRSKADLIKVLQQYSTDFAPTALRMYFTSNHDENSWCGTEFEKYTVWAKAFAVFSHTWCGLPLIYSGQELPVLRRLKFFDKDAIDWSGGAQLHEFYKRLLSLRKRQEAIAAGVQSFPALLHADDDDKVLAFSRSMNDSRILVFLNLDVQPCWYAFSAGHLFGSYRDIFSEEIVHIKPAGNIFVEAAGYRVLELLP